MVRVMVKVRVRVRVRVRLTYCKNTRARPLGCKHNKLRVRVRVKVRNAPLGVLMTSINSGRLIN